MERLDQTDERILTELTEHARATFAEIGQKANLSAPAVKRRVDRMLDSGVIKGFTTVIDRNALGWNTEAFVQVFCHGTIAPDQLRAAWVDMPEVVSAATVTGTSDAILHVLARDMRHLEAALERIRSSADIERSESLVVRSILVDRMRTYPLSPGRTGAPTGRARWAARRVRPRLVWFRDRTRAGLLEAHPGGLVQSRLRP